MGNNIRIIVSSHRDFDSRMNELGLNDSNVENAKHLAFISIIGTDECLKYYLHEEDTKHWFSDNHKNVINLDFDDLSRDFTSEGHTYKAMTMEQAEKTVNFIEEQIENGVQTIYIHCRAGISRSRAIGEFISRIKDTIYYDRELFTSRVNQGVLSRLQHAYWKKHKMFEYSVDDAEYPTDLTN